MAESAGLKLPDPGSTEALGQALAGAIDGAVEGAAQEPRDPLVIFLEGGLGAGKTCLARAILRGLGHGGRVPSPTYTLVEPYELPGRRVLHLDLYRLSDPGELDYLGLGDDLTDSTVLLVEWPEQGAGRLPDPDLVVALSHAGDGREARIGARSPAGRSLLARLALTLPAMTDPGLKA